MTWVRFDDNCPDHPKVVGLSDAAFRLWVCSIAWCGRHKTDGWIPAQAVKAITPIRRPTTAAKQLVEAGLWEEVEHQKPLLDRTALDEKTASQIKNGSSQIKNGSSQIQNDSRTIQQSAAVTRSVLKGFLIHDYLFYQDSASDIAEKKEQKRKAGQAGGQARARRLLGKNPSENVPTYTTPTDTPPINNNTDYIPEVGNWPDKIASSADFLKAVSSWGWCLSISAKETATCHSLTRAGPIARHEYEYAREVTEQKSPSRPASYFLSVVARQREESAVGTKTTDAPPRPMRPEENPNIPEHLRDFQKNRPPWWPDDVEYWDGMMPYHIPMDDKPRISRLRAEYEAEQKRQRKADAPAGDPSAKTEGMQEA